MPPPIPPRWASTNAADIVEPNEAKKDIGWLVDDIPPHGFFNWFKRRTYDCLAYMLPFFTDDGLKRIRRFANSTELKGIAAPAAGDLALGPGIGLYVFITTGPAAAAATDDLYYFAPNDGTAGRWVHGLALLLNQPLGIAKLDAAGKLAATHVQNGIAGLHFIERTGGPTGGRVAYTEAIDAAVIGGTWVDFAPLPAEPAPKVSVPGCAVGDVLLIDGFVWARQSDPSGCCVQLTGGPASSRVVIPGTQHQLALGASIDEKVVFHARMTVTTPGTNEIRVQGYTGAAPNQLVLKGQAHLRVTRIST